MQKILIVCWLQYFRRWLELNIFLLCLHGTQTRLQCVIRINIGCRDHYRESSSQCLHYVWQLKFLRLCT